jgi:hypothetical protein
MAIGRISGSVLKSNLTRNGTDLAFETDLLYLDVTNSRIGIGTSSPSTTLDVDGTVNATTVTGGTLTASGTGTSALLTLTTTEASATASPVIDLKRNSGSPADSDNLGQIRFLGENDNDQEVVYGRLTASAKDVSDGSEDGILELKLMENGTLANSVRFESTGLFINTSNTITFEGSSADAYETILTVVNPTGSDKTVSLPNATDTLVGKATTDTLTNKTLTAPTVNAGTMTGDFDFADNSKIIMGDGDDLKIYHSGSHSIIQDAGAGYLRIRGSKTQIMGNSHDEMQGVFTEDGSAELYYNGTKTFETISTGVQTTGTVNINGAYTFPTADGSASTFLQTDGSGTLSFAEAGGGGGGNNTAVKQFNYYKLGTTSAVIDEFDLDEFRGAVYNVTMEDHDNSLIGHVKVSVVHNDSTPFISVYDLNEDSTNIVNFTAAISGDMLQLSGSTQSSTHTNLRIYRVALGDHHETVTNTNSKIIKASTAITTAGVTLDSFTKTEIQGAKYVVLFKDSTQTEYQISEVSLTHNGTTVFFNDYAKVSTRSDYAFTMTSTISSSTLTLTAASTGGTSATAILYRQDLGSKTKLGEVDNTLYGKKSDIDTTVETIDSFDVFKYRSARYFINIGHSGDTEYQNSEITLTVNSAGSGATISESIVRTGSTSLATFTADVSSGKARLRMQGTSANNVIYFARLAMEANNIYRADAQTSDDLFITHNNITLKAEMLDLSGATGSLKLPSGTTAQRSTGAVGMIRYNSTTSTYERYDSSGWTAITTTASTTDLDDTTTGVKTSIGTSATNIDTFTSSSYDSAFYLVVTRDEINEETATDQISLVHNNTTAFVASGGGVRSGDNDQLTYTADISTGTVRLRGTGTSDVNSIKFFRIAMGDSTSATSSGKTAIVLNTDVDSAVENIDTWAHASYRGAKYYISANNTSKTELQNIECSVVHNGTTAFIATYNNVYTGNNALIALTADIDGDDVRLRATGNEPNTAVKMFRILLGDSESDTTGDNTKVVGAVTVSSSATAIDTFSSDSYTGSHYVVVGYNSGESGTPASVSEVYVVHDGTTAYVSSGPIVSSKGTDQLTFTAALSGTTVTLNALSTSGGSTTVNAFRTHIQRSAAGASTSIQVLTSNDQAITGTKTLSDDVKLKFGTGGDLEIYHDGSNSYIDDAGTGTIFYRSGTQTFQNAAGSKTMAVFNAANSVDLNYNNTTRLQTSSTGVTVAGAVAMGVVSDPSTVANYAHVYAKDDSASAEVYVRDEAGNVTKLSPHNKQGEWEYFSRNTITGKTVRVNMEEMIKDIEKLTGKKYIKEE